jgi:hypothetical protein
VSDLSFVEISRLSSHDFTLKSKLEQF